MLTRYPHLLPGLDGVFPSANGAVCFCIAICSVSARMRVAVKLDRMRLVWRHGVN